MALCKTNAFSGEGGSGGGSDLLLVKSYTPAYSQISSFVMSGMINDSDNSGYDLTPANGTYKVTTETASKLPSERIYKHTSQNYYVYYIPESADGMYWGSGWAINGSIVYDTMSVLMYNSSLKEIAAGTSNWSGEMNMLYMPVTISDIVQTEVPAAVIGKKVTGYNPATLQYTIDSEEVAITGYDYEPQEHSIYSCNGTRLVGEPIGNEGGSHLYCYIPWRGDTPYGKSYDPREGNNYYHYATAWKYPSMSMYNDQIGQYHIFTIDGVTCSGSVDDGVRMQSSSDLYDKFRTNNKLWAIPPDANRKWSAGAAFNRGGQSKKQRMLWVRVNNVATMHIEADWTVSTPKITVYKDDAAVITYTNSGLSSGWHHAVLTYDYDTKMFILYVDGVKRGEYSFVFERSRYFDTFLFGSGHPDGNGGYMIGYICEIKLWDIPLTAAMVSAEYQRVMASM